MTDIALSRSPATKSLLAILATSGGAIIVLLFCSLVFPSATLFLLGAIGVNNIIPLALTEATAANVRLLERLQFGEYAIGFAALRTGGTVVLVLATTAFTAHFVVWRQKGIWATRPGYPGSTIVLMFGLALLWWGLFSHDFYLAYDSDFTGIHRPWFGSVFFAAMVWVAPLFLTGGVALIVKTVRSGSNSGGHA